MKQTAVEWLIDQLTPSISLQQKHIDELKNQAKEMEKQQIISAFNNGEFFAIDYYHPNSSSVDGSETYYNETYGGEK